MKLGTVLECISCNVESLEEFEIIKFYGFFHSGVSPLTGIIE
jgi:hypothetical protein